MLYCLLTCFTSYLPDYLTPRADPEQIAFATSDHEDDVEDATAALQNAVNALDQTNAAGGTSYLQLSMHAELVT